MQNLSKELPGLNPALQEEWLALRKKLLQKPLLELEKELQKQITKKLAGYLAAIPLFCLELYKYHRVEEDIPVIWQEGSTFLYNYKSEVTPTTSSLSPVLIIPSLINRHYILDLEEGNSFVRYLSGNGIDTYLASWGEPLQSELGLSLDDYVSRTEEMIDIVYAKTGRKVILTGYCMGGLLSLAASIGKSDKIQAIAFLATPWDFHSEDFPRFRLSAENLTRAESILEGYSKIPASLMQALFYYTHAHLIGHKFEIYPLINSSHTSQRGFLAIEHWVNDGISMTKAVAKECFVGWVNNNNVAKLQWKIKDQIVSPAQISHFPAFFAIPQKDSIVPTSCALPLADYFNECKVIKPNTGHVGMIVGACAKSQVWEPFLKWVEIVIR